MNNTTVAGYDIVPCADCFEPKQKTDAAAQTNEQQEQAK